MGYPKPSAKQLREAFTDHGVQLVVHRRERSRDQWANGLRAATCHHTAGKNSVEYLATQWRLPGANCVIQNGRYNGMAKDGLAVILAWGSAWHSGTGGPWPGVAGRDALHLVSWGMEFESVGTRPDMTDPMIENGARMLAALIDLGMPRQHIHRHEDWTDGTGPVGGYPLPTNGRKIDTNNRWYPTSFWVKHAGLYVKGAWDGVVPDFQAVVAAAADPELASKASWRVAGRLADLGLYAGTPAPVYVQGYPRRAVTRLQRQNGWTPDGEYTHEVHRALFA